MCRFSVGYISWNGAQINGTILSIQTTLSCWFALSRVMASCWCYFWKYSRIWVCHICIWYTLCTRVRTRTQRPSTCCDISLSCVLFYSQSAYLLFLFLHFSLGHRRWDKFEDSYRVMMFSNGDKCWNGPDRSLKVLILMLLSWVMFLFSLV